MTPLISTDSLPVAQHDALHAALAPAVRERLCHLFRATLRDGFIHPLYLPVLRYRHAQAQP